MEPKGSSRSIKGTWRWKRIAHDNMQNIGVLGGSVDKGFEKCGFRLPVTNPKILANKFWATGHTWWEVWTEVWPKIVQWGMDAELWWIDRRGRMDGLPCPWTGPQSFSSWPLPQHYCHTNFQRPFLYQPLYWLGNCYQSLDWLQDGEKDRKRSLTWTWGLLHLDKELAVCVSIFWQQYQKMEVKIPLLRFQRGDWNADVFWKLSALLFVPMMFVLY